jgi:Tol biopolymer transport system component
MLKLRFDGDNRIINLIEPNGDTKSLPFEFTSEPRISPDNQKVIFISPLEWETKGNLYLLDLTTGNIGEIISYSDQNTPKDAVWLNDQYIAVIIGYVYGTVAVGGDIYIYNVNCQKLSRLTYGTPSVQITTLEVRNGILCYEGIKYTDEQKIKFEPYKGFYDLASLDKGMVI